MRRLVLTLGCCFVFVGCTDALFADPDGGPGEDASARDSGQQDSGTDAGGEDMGPSDMGPGDMGPPDMGPPPDLGPCDPCRPRTGDLVISEIMPDSDVASDDFGEWFELHNPSDTVTYDLIGCVLADLGNTHAVGAELLLAPGATISLARFPNESVGGFDPDYSYGPTLKFSNSGDVVRVTCGATLVDEVDFTTWVINKGFSFSLDPGSLDAAANDNQDNWCNGMSPYNTSGAETDFGSPGMMNPPCL